MARNFAKINTEIWKDDHFKSNLTVDSQWLYFVLLSQPNLNGAGVLPLQDRRWKKLAEDLTADRIEDALAELQAHWYVLVDEETEEVLIRTFIRGDGIWKQPNVLKGALGLANKTMSDTLKAVIWHEVDRLPLHELPEDRAEKTRTLIERVRPTLPGTLPEGFMEPPKKASIAPFAAPEQANHAAVIPITRPAQEKPQITIIQPALPAEFLAGFGEGFREGFPEPSGEGEVEGEGEGESLGKEEIPKTSSSGVTAPNAGTLIAEWISSRATRPPGEIIGQASKAIKKLLEVDRIPYETVRAGVIAWDRKRKHPSTIPSFVNEVMDGGPQLQASRPAADPRYAPGTGSYVDPNTVYTDDPAVVFGTTS